MVFFIISRMFSPVFAMFAVSIFEVVAASVGAVVLILVGAISRYFLFPPVFLLQSVAFPEDGRAGVEDHLAAFLRRPNGDAVHIGGDGVSGFIVPGADRSGLKTHQGVEGPLPHGFAGVLPASLAGGGLGGWASCSSSAWLAAWSACSSRSLRRRSWVKRSLSRASSHEEDHG